MTEAKRKAFLIIISILVTLLFGEILLQLAHRFTNNEWVWQKSAFKVDYIIPVDDRRSYTLRPDYYDEVQNIPINQRGERNTPQDVDINNADGLVVCLGDSVPFGAGIGNESTYPFYLAQTFSDLGLNIYVINAGTPSYNLRQSLDRLEFEIFQNVNPERVRVITLQVANDISLLAYYRENWSPEITWADVRFNINPVPLSNYLAIPHYISQILSRPKGTSGTYTSEKMAKSIASMLDEELAKLQDSQPTAAVVLLPINPFYYQNKHTEKNEALRLWEQHAALAGRWEPLIRDFNSTLLAATETHENAYYFDVISAMDQVEREGLYVDYIHLSKEGSQFQAQLVADFLVENALIQLPD